MKRSWLWLVFGSSLLALVTIGPGIPYRTTEVVSVRMAPLQMGSQAFTNSLARLEAAGYHYAPELDRGRINLYGVTVRHRVWAFWQLRIRIPPPHDW